MFMTDDFSRTFLSDVRDVCDIVTSTLGPFGATKIIIQDNGTVTLTTTGSEVLERCDLNEPAVELLRTAAAGFRSVHRDGTSTLVALVGTLLEEAESLRDLGLHPTTIERGYRSGFEIAREYVHDHDLPVSSAGTEAIARTALTATRTPDVRAQMSGDISDIAEILERESRDGPFDQRAVSVVSRVGGTQSDTELVRGIVLNDSPVLETMPRSADSGIALVSSNIDVARAGGEMSRRSELVLTLSPETFEERQAFGKHELEQFKAGVEGIVGAGCQVVMTTASVNDRVKRILANAGLMAVQRIDEEDLYRLARGTGATVQASLVGITADALGSGSVSVRREAGRDMTFIETTNDRIYTLFCRAPDPRTLGAFSRSVESAIAAVTAATRSGRVVPGGGAVEIGAAGAIRRSGRTVRGREQLGVEAVSKALTVVPRTLARTAGLGGTDAVIELRAKHDGGTHTAGVDALFGDVSDVISNDDPLVEPADTKLAIWESAIDLAVRLLRIDERLSANDLKADEGIDDEQVALDE